LDPLLAAKPAADAALRLCSLLFHSLVKLVNGTVDLFARLLAQVLRSSFGIGEFAFGVGRLRRQYKDSDSRLWDLQLGQTYCWLGLPVLLPLSWLPFLYLAIRSLSERRPWRHRLFVTSVEVENSDCGLRIPSNFF
jgi:hypothetical protein